MNKSRERFYLFLIILVSIVSAVFVYPYGIGGKYYPWKLGLDLIGGIHLVYDIDLSKVDVKDQTLVLDGLRDVIEKRVNLFGISESQVFISKSEDKYNLIVELPGVYNVDEAIKTIGATPFLEFKEVVGEGDKVNYVSTGLDGRYITGARVEFNSTNNNPQVAISFNDEGAKIFEKLTERNIGKPLAIFLDGNLIEAPIVQEKISQGNAVITGKFSVTDAKTLASRFNAGALPAPISLINQFVVSPFLGIDSLKKSLLAGAIGTLLVLIFMIIYYGKNGFFASLALLIYIVLTAAIFKVFGATMTLASIAGFIITIGMAVDANILIFERMKEESRKGISGEALINEGFRRAWPSIRDSNFSSIITGFILYIFSSSFVKGFGLTLFVGVLVSMFSAITTTRLFLKSFIKNKNV